MFIGASAGIGRYFPRPVSGGAEVDLLLEDYPGAEAAFSLRQLSKTYAGSAVEVFNGTSSADIGFVSGALDTAALAAHCGSNDGLVRTWYDQSGNANDATQSNSGSMPKIYDGASASVVLDNGAPAVDFDGVNDTMQTPNFSSTLGFPNFLSSTVSFDDTDNMYFMDSDSPG